MSILRAHYLLLFTVICKKKSRYRESMTTSPVTDYIAFLSDIVKSKRSHSSLNNLYLNNLTDWCDVSAHRYSQKIAFFMIPQTYSCYVFKMRLLEVDSPQHHHRLCDVTHDSRISKINIPIRYCLSERIRKSERIHQKKTVK